MPERLFRLSIVVAGSLLAGGLLVSTARFVAAADGIENGPSALAPTRIISVLHGAEQPATEPPAVPPQAVPPPTVDPQNTGPPTAEPIPPGIASGLPAHDDAAMVAAALARPQPQIQATRNLGPDEALLLGAATTRPWGLSASAWEAPAFCHRPLYFEDENLERHGHSYGLVQPAVSAAHFAGRAITWPYLAGAFPPHECIYTLGRERAGSCAPYRLYRPPVSVHGALYEGAAAAGISFVVP